MGADSIRDSRCPKPNPAVSFPTAHLYTPFVKFACTRSTAESVAKVSDH